ncbi:hypothetical protein NP233_g7655 [Leucocoprinus birnbaumii]|uniref:Reverse transcriptase domain-containing protein n=1 Tax=Leucocoprinus birnbaumii TaxID=56174 RepID=A0AAD5YSK1_9AGAR|nr:hypothetical protein NP233_g7655 [Leucocoprinus birnbaumii]
MFSYATSRITDLVLGQVSDKPPTSAAYGRTLGFVTNAKLDELEKQREAYKEFSSVLEDANEPSLSMDDEGHALVDRLGILYRSVLEHLAPDEPRLINGTVNVDDLCIWLARVRTDPNFDKKVVKEWIAALESHIKQGERKLEFAKLCGRLYTDWLESRDSVTVRSDVSGPLPQQDTAKGDTKQEGREEMHEQVARLRSIIFQPTNMDTEALEAYLASVFSSKAAQAILDDMRVGMAKFGSALRDRTITANDMRWTVESLLASDLMSPDKRAALREFTDNQTVLEELSNVINMRLRAFGSWKWPNEAITVDMRRYLHGKYRAFTDPDILDALFLQWVGIMWGMKFKSDARDVFHSEAWKIAVPGDAMTSIPSDSVSADVSPSTVNSERKHQRNSLFLTGHLPDNVSPKPFYDEPADAAGDDLGDTAGATVEVKQQLLNILSTECYLNLSLHGSQSIVRTDIDWFGPSLPHESILTILRFFGVKSDWLEFFRTFLRMPVRFPGEPDAHTRVRGTPISYALSGFFGEVVLFGMDFAINQRTNGLFLYRIHDDIWFWDSNPRRCALAWKEMNEYAKLVGLTFNTSKTGSACVQNDGTPPPTALDLELPTGDIRWGFLKFDSKEARFVIDQDLVDGHIKELRRQLGHTKSVLGWISVYNKYMAFFVRNFGGRPAQCFGRQHVIEVTKTLVRVQQEIIGTEGSATGSGGGVVEHLENELAKRYDVHDLPKGYFYFPLSSGGLALRDPLIDILVMGESMSGNARAAIDDALQKEQEPYEIAKKEWELEQRQAAIASGADSGELPPLVYIPFRAYCEISSWNIYQLYSSLAAVHQPRQVQITPLIRSSFTARGRNEVLGSGRESYKGWVYEAYGRDVVRMFGALEIVDPRMIPIGLVHLYKTSRISWDQ